jgi:dienelactone hydrolase
MKAILCALIFTVTLWTSSAWATDVLLRPTGDGPFPAVVLMHSCGGIRPYHLHWAEQLQAQGYVALVVDSFGPRGIQTVCDNLALSSQMVQRERVDDAYGALAHLKSLPYVDGERVALMGWSHGAGVALIAPLKNRPEGAFMATVALYPYCYKEITKPVGRPTLILVGEWDDWTPADRCQAMVKSYGGPVELKVFPATYHSFDDERYVRGEVYLRHKLQYNQEAALDAERLVTRFLGEQIGGAR